MFSFSSARYVNFFYFLFMVKHVFFFHEQEVKLYVFLNIKLGIGYLSNSN